MRKRDWQEGQKLSLQQARWGEGEEKGENHQDTEEQPGREEESQDLT